MTLHRCIATTRVAASPPAFTTAPAVTAATRAAARVTAHAAAVRSATAVACPYLASPALLPATGRHI